MLQTIRSRLGSALLMMGLLFGVSSAHACPFCSPNVTLSERIDQAHAAYLVEWIAGVPGNAELRETGRTEVQIAQVFKQGAEPLPVGDPLSLPDYSPGRPGEQFLLFGQLREGEVLRWDGLLTCSPELRQYLSSRPDPSLPATERLPYFISYLEHPDETIAVDAYSEFANARYDEVRTLASEFPRERLVAWVTEPAAESGRVARIGFYGMLLGLCGNDADADVIERYILAPSDELRLGIEGVMAGYIMLRGERGLQLLADNVLQPGRESSEAYPFQQAVSFQWEFGNGRISKAALRAALRRLVDDPKLADLVIVDLGRWEDLQLVDRLIDLYGRPEYANLPTQTAIARYYLTISELAPAGRTSEEQDQIRRAGLKLAELRQRDPEVVERAEHRFPRLSSTDSASPHATAPPTAAISLPAGPTAGMARAESQLSEADGSGYSVWRLMMMAGLAAGIIYGIVTWPRGDRSPGPR